MNKLSADIFKCDSEFSYCLTFYVSLCSENNSCLNHNVEVRRYKWPTDTWLSRPLAELGVNLKQRAGLIRPAYFMTQHAVFEVAKTQPAICQTLNTEMPSMQHKANSTSQYWCWKSTIFKWTKSKWEIINK